MFYIKSGELKKAIFFLGTLFCFFAAPVCRPRAEKDLENEIWQQKLDSMGNATLDSIYKKQVRECDSLQKIRIPVLVDSFLRNDSMQRILEKKK